MGAFKDLANKNKQEKEKGAPSSKSINFSTRAVTPAVDFSKYGGKGTTTDTGSTTKIRADLSKYQTVTDPNARPDIPSYNIANSPLLQVANQIESIPTGKGLVPGRGAVEMDEAPRNINEELALKAKQIPVVGSILRGLDYAGQKLEPAAKLMRSFYVPGGGMANISGLTGAAENAVSRIAPQLANTLAGRVGQKALSEAITGGVLGVGQEQMVNPNASNTDLLKGAGYGALLGGGLGAVGKGVGEAVNYGRQSAQEIAQNALRNVEANKRTVTSPFMQGAADNAVSKGYTEQVGKTFGQTPKERIISTYSHEVPKTQQTTTPILKVGEEATPSQRIRANYKNQLDNGNLSPELQNAIKNTDQTYNVASNRASINAANEAIKNLPAAESKFLLNEAGGADHIATGYRLMQELDAVGEHARALKVADKLAADLTKSGQTSQAASILSRLSPEGQLLNLVRTAEKSGKTVSVADSVKFKELAAKVQERSGAGVRANQFNEILNRLERGGNVGVDDIKKLSNFLSGAEKIAKPKVLKVVDEIPAELKQPRKREKIVSFLEEAEQAALARIAARRNNLNALPINEWADHGIVVASQIAKGLIKASTHVEDLVKMFGEEIRPYATEVFQNAQKLLKQSSSHLGSNDIEKANDALRRVTGEKQPLSEKIVQKYLRENEKVSTKDIETLRELAKKVTALSGDQRIEADIAMQKILNSYEKSSAWDKLLAIRYMSMLLNTGTQAINAVSGPIMATTGYVSDILPAMVDSLMHATLKTKRSTTLYGSNPLKFIAGYIKNLKTGAKAGAQGVNPAGIQSTNEIRGLAFKSLYNPLGLAERGLGAVAKGADYATYKTVFDSEMVKQGFLDAKNSGVKGKDNIQKHIEKFVNNPPEKAIEQADRIGKNTTFQRSDRTGGQAANWLNNAPSFAKPAVNAIFPFVKTPINIATSAVKMTPPGALIKGLYNLSSKSDASKREIIRDLSLGVTGTGLSALGYYLNQIGVITGANDSGDKDVNAIREQAGKGKYRFNTSALMRYMGAMLNGEGTAKAEKAAQYQEGDKQFDYNKLQPLAFPIATGAALSENKGKPTSEKITNTLMDSAGSLLGMSTLKGLQDTFQPQYGGTQGESVTGILTRLGESFFKSFSPSALAQEARRQDPTVRKTAFNEGPIKDVGDYFKSRTPGFSQSLPPQITTLGMTKQNAPGVMGQYMNPYKSQVEPYSKAATLISNLIDKTGDFTLAPSAPEKKVTGKDRQGKPVSIPIPADRYAKLQEQVGKEIIDKVLTLNDGLSDADKATKLKKIYSDAKAKYSKEVKNELGVR